MILSSIAGAFDSRSIATLGDVGFAFVAHRRQYPAVPFKVLFERFDGAAGAVVASRWLATLTDGELRAPHHTVSGPAFRAELGLASRGLLLLDECEAFSRALVRELGASLRQNWSAPYGPIVHPAIVVYSTATPGFLADIGHVDAWIEVSKDGFRSAIRPE